jgi:hypothetical protein
MEANKKYSPLDIYFFLLFIIWGQMTTIKHVSIISCKKPTKEGGEKTACRLSLWKRLASTAINLQKGSKFHPNLI